MFPVLLVKTAPLQASLALVLRSEVSGFEF